MSLKLLSALLLMGLTTQVSFAALKPAQMAHSGQAHTTWATETVKQKLKALPAGTIQKSYQQPNSKAKFIYHDQNDNGDFFYEHIYYFDGKVYHYLGGFVSTGHYPAPKWGKGFVSFQAREAIGPEQVNILQYEYYPAKSQLKHKLIKTESMQHTG